MFKRSRLHTCSFAGAVVAALASHGALAALNEIGPIDPATGFPAYVDDAAGFRLEPCNRVDPVSEGADIINDFPCGGLELNPEPSGEFVEGNIAEFTYYRAEANTVSTTGVRLRLRMEVQGGLLPPATINNAVRLVARDLGSPGTLTVTSPFDVEEIEVTADDIVRLDRELAGGALGIDVGLGGAGLDLALEGNIMCFWGNGTETTADGKPYLGDGLTEAPLVPNPSFCPDQGAEQLVFRVDFDADDDAFDFQAETDLFAVEAKLLPPELTVPAPGATLAGPSDTFEWIPHSFPVAEWWVYVGSRPGLFDYANSLNLFGQSTYTVNNLPIGGEDIYVRLWFREANGEWLYVDESYFAADFIQMSSPAGTELTGSTETFEWAATNGAVVDEWWLYVGTTLGGRNIRNSGSLGAAETTLTVNGIPENGEPVYVRLWYRQTGGQWKSKDFLYTSVSGPTMTAPSTDVPLPGSTVNFAWAANQGTVVQWWLYVGTTPGGQEIVDSGDLGLVTSLTVNGVPENGAPVYVRLWYRNVAGGLWNRVDTVYTAAAPPNSP